VGGSEVFGLFLPLYDVFYLSRVPDVMLPEGRPVFPGMPRSTPEEMLETHGLHEAERAVLDPARNVDLVTWRRHAV
jgi:dihydrofolate reductase